MHSMYCRSIGEVSSEKRLASASRGWIAQGRPETAAISVSYVNKHHQDAVQPLVSAAYPSEAAEFQFLCRPIA